MNRTMLDENIKSLLPKLREEILHLIHTINQHPQIEASTNALFILKELENELTREIKVHNIDDFNTKLQLNLNVLSEQDSPDSIYDIEGLRHHIIIEEKNRESFLDELTQDYRKMIDSLLEEYEDD